MGVRGISLAREDKVISLTILHHFKATPAERLAYLKQSAAFRRAAIGEDVEEITGEAADDVLEESIPDLGPEVIEEKTYNHFRALRGKWALPSSFILTVNAQATASARHPTSPHFRAGRKGIRATDLSRLDEIGSLIAAFPVEPSDQIMLVSDRGTLIRVPIEGIRFASRTSKGVRIFNTASGEKVVSVEHIPDPGEAVAAEGPGDGDDMEGNPDDGTPPDDAANEGEGGPA
jgi:DNA gyrase subunit A